MDEIIILIRSSYKKTWYNCVNSISDALTEELSVFVARIFSLFPTFSNNEKVFLLNVFSDIKYAENQILG